MKTQGTFTLQKLRDYLVILQGRASKIRTAYNQSSCEFTKGRLILINMALCDRIDTIILATRVLLETQDVVPFKAPKNDLQQAHANNSSVMRSYTRLGRDMHQKRIISIKYANGNNERRIEDI
jgi:hypothetical protein